MMGLTATKTNKRRFFLLLNEQELHTTKDLSIFTYKELCVHMQKCEAFYTYNVHVYVVVKKRCGLRPHIWTRLHGAIKHTKQKTKIIFNSH